MQRGFCLDRSIGYQQITDLSSAQGLSLPVGTVWALIRPENCSVRWRDDGVNPSSSVGYPLQVSEELEYTGTELSALRVIQQSPGAVLNVLYFGGPLA